MRAAIQRALAERQALSDYTRTNHRDAWRPIQKQRLQECGEYLREAQRMLRRFERVMNFGLRKGISARRMAHELPPISPDFLDDPWAVHVENSRLRAENAALAAILGAKLRVGFDPKDDLRRPAARGQARVRPHIAGG